jgi:hypothetical protein
MADKFYARLMAAMQLMGNPVKDTKGHNYKYAQLDQVMDVVKPALYANGLAVRQGVKVDGDLLTLETVVFDDDNERVMDVRTIEHMTDPQKQGSYETYMRRYALLTVFGLAPEDDDGQSAKPQQRRQKADVSHDSAKPTASAVAMAKARLWTALSAHCDAHGIDANSEIELLGGKEFMSKQTTEWLNAKADYYEAN